MKALHKALFLAPLIAAVAAAPAAAQSWKWDLGVNAGYAHFTNSLSTDQTAISDQQGGSKVHFKNGGLLGTQLGFWFGPKFGLRLNGRYSDRPLTGNDMSTDFVNHTNLWGATADLMFRFKAPAPEFTKMEMLPYLALGAGAKFINTAHAGFTCSNTDNTSVGCGPFVTGLPNRPMSWALTNKNSLAFLAGLGADWRLARSVALRTEISDMIYKPHIYQANFTGVTPPATFALTTGDNVAKTTHEIAGQIGLQFLFGVARPPVVAVAPPPAPPAPPPAPAPTVTREATQVCVIDPTVANGIRMQDAFVVGGKDTVVVVNGQDQPLSTAVGTVPVASGATWYVQGQPLTMTVGTGHVEYATYGTPRVIGSSDLAYLGTINGTPVYADRDDVADIINDLNTANSANRGQDLGVILNNQKTLREGFDKVKVLYVPMNATGCTFQAVQRQEEVRKGGAK